MPDWPHYVTHALDLLLCHTDSEAEAMIESFVRHWGGIDPDTLARVLREGDEEGRVFALLALGFAGVAQARESLLPFIESERPLERWASALGLGWLQEPRALPALFAMLTEFQPASPPSKDKFYYNDWPGKVPQILGLWGRHDAVPPLRQALQWSVYRSCMIPAFSEEDPNSIDKRAAFKRRSERDAWEHYQEELVYALGRLQAFGALTGVVGADQYLDTWRVHLLLGSLHGQFAVPKVVVRWEHVPALEAEVRRLLGERFGLTVSEQQDSLRSYKPSKLSRVAGIYRQVRQQTPDL